MVNKFSDFQYTSGHLDNKLVFSSCNGGFQVTILMGHREVDAIYLEDKYSIYHRAGVEIDHVKEIVEGKMNSRDKCQALLDIIRGKSWEQEKLK